MWGKRSTLGTFRNNIHSHTLTQHHPTRLITASSFSFTEEEGAFPSAISGGYKGARDKPSVNTDYVTTPMCNYAESVRWVSVSSLPSFGYINKIIPFCACMN